MKELIDRFHLSETPFMYNGNKVYMKDEFTFVSQISAGWYVVIIMSNGWNINKVQEIDLLFNPQLYFV